MHVESLHHPVVASLPPPTFKAWVQILCLAKMGDGIIPRVSEIAFHLRCGLNFAIRVTDELVNDYGLLDRLDGGVFRPKNWDKHQYKSDVSTERVRTFRKRKGNVSETPPEAEYRVQSQKQSAEKPLAPPPALAETIRKNALVETIIRGLAADQPDPQDFESGVDAAVREILSSANPEITVKTMKENLPQWWAAMRDGRARVKPMRFVIVDRDYLRIPAAAKQSRKSAAEEARLERERYFDAAEAE